MTEVKRDNYCKKKTIIITLFICVFTGFVVDTHMSAANPASISPLKNKISQKNRIEIPPQLLTKTLKKRDPTLVVSAESVLKKIQEKKELFLIDVRNKEEFDKFRITGSINIPLFAIKTKAFLKSKKLVLFNEGYCYSELEKVCINLKDSGFESVSILNGGLSSWREKGGILEGNTFEQSKLNKIPPNIFFTERNYENWIVIDVSNTKRTEKHNLIHQTAHIPFNIKKPKKFISKFKAIINNHSKKPLLSILIFNEDGKSYDKIERLIQQIETNNVFYLKGGLEGYKTFLQKQVHIWENKGKIKKKECRGCSVHEKS